MGLSESGVKLTAQGADAFNRQLEQAGRAVNEFGGKAGGPGAAGLERLSVATVALGTALGNLAVRGFDTATRGITSFISSGWELNKTIENATAQLTVFTGSQEAANEAIRIAQRRAAATPFAFEDYARSLGAISAIQKQNGGELEDYLDLVERLAAANPAEGFEGATFALREAMSGDFLSLQDRFNIPKSVIANLRETGASVETLDAALTGMGYTTELITGLSQTFDGRLSTLKDSIQSIARAFTDPIFAFFSEQLVAAQVGIDGFAERAHEVAIEWGENVVTALQYAKDSFITFRDAFAGNWVDNEIIQPGHRLIGVFGTDLREAVDTMTTAWGMWNAAVQKGKDLWNSPWVQEKIVNPFQTLINEVMEGLVGDFSKLNYEWWLLKGTGDEWNDLMLAGQQMWQALVGFVNALGIDTGIFSEKLGDMNIEMSESHSLGELLVDVFKLLTKLIGFATIGINLATTGMLLFRRGIDAVIEGWRLLYDTMAGGLPGVTGGLSDANPWVTAPGAGVGATGTTNAPPSTQPPKNVGGTGKRGAISVNVSVNVPPNTSPRVAAGYVSDGVTQAMRSKGLV